MTAIGLIALLLGGPFAPTSQGDELPRGISVFPAPAAPSAAPTTPAPALQEREVGVGAVVATVATLPHRAVSCVIGDVIGFFVGSALRVPFAPVAAAGAPGSETLDRLGQNVVQLGCTDDLVVTSEYFREWRPLAESTSELVPEAR